VFGNLAWLTGAFAGTILARGNKMRSGDDDPTRGWELMFGTLVILSL
jgi:hypothetical protein